MRSMGGSGGLSPRELEYYSRQIVLKEIGYEGQLRLKGARVCLVGVGGLGSSIATQLAAIGVGYLRLVDRDLVELSNLHRQHLYDMDHLGYPKVEVAAEKLRRLNSEVEVEPLPLSVNPSNAREVVEGVDVVVDGLDRMAPRYAVNRACVKAGTPYVFGSAIMTMGNVSTILQGETPCLECFYGNLDDDTLPTCATVGVHPSIVTLIASIEASEAVKVILGEQPSLAGILLVCDLRDASFEKIKVERAEGCPVCGPHPRSEPMPLRMQPVEEVCSREGRRTLILSPRRILRVNMEALQGLLREKGLGVVRRSRLAVTFKPSEGASATVLSSGVMVVEGFREAEEARGLYRELLVKGLGLQSEV
ncbi:HesA/MoeB/ThiF family protein [Candidatus Bathyarchaeota archaeon]|nr:HesA/MoeB/ThiF family protein [Candidatus Bathyarchaeota archaeon]